MEDGGLNQASLEFWSSLVWLATTNSPATSSGFHGATPKWFLGWLVPATRLGLSQAPGKEATVGHMFLILPDCSVAFFASFDITGCYVEDRSFARHGELVTLSACQAGKR